MSSAQLSFACYGNEYGGECQDDELNSVQSFSAIPVGKQPHDELADECPHENGEVEQQLRMFRHATSPIDDVDHRKYCVDCEKLGIKGQHFCVLKLLNREGRTSYAFDFAKVSFAVRALQHSRTYIC